MRINHNISAIRANRNLAITNSSLDSSMEKLSSGYRITKAADDAAGLAISQKMRTQINGLEQASRNSSDGISVIQTAEGALSEVENMLQRMRVLAVQASNGTNTTEDCEALQSEIDQLNSEIQRISETTEFNTKSLLNGNLSNRTYNESGTLDTIYLSDTVDPGEYELVFGQTATVTNFTLGSAATAPAGTVTINGHAVTITDGMSIADFKSAISAECTSQNITADFAAGTFKSDILGSGHNVTVEVEPAALASLLTIGSTVPGRNGGGSQTVTNFTLSGAVAAPAGRININDQQVDITDGESMESVKGKIRDKCEAIGITVDFDNGTFTANAFGSNEKVEVYVQPSELAAIIAVGTTETGADPSISLGSGFSSSATIVVNGDIVTVTDYNNFEMQIKAGGTGTIKVLDAGPMDLQVGANEGQTMIVKIPNMNPKTLGTEDVSVCNAKNAQQAITICDQAIQKVSNIRAKLGAYQNRLDYAIQNLDLSNENMTEAMSRIEDTDMAKEMTEYTQKNVLAQAGNAMLAQANERPQAILSLLQA